jgi:hypothetical protein
MRQLARVAGATLVLLLSGGCTGSDTGDIWLLASATPRAPPKPPPPPPKKPSCPLDASTCAECARDADCADPAKPRCRATDAVCVECLDEGDCTRDPAHPVCDVAHNHCVAR